MQIKFTDKAIAHLESILDIYIEYAGELSAMKFSKAVDAKLNKLLRFPEIGFPEPLLVDRKYFYRATIIQGNYKMIYYVDNDIIWVVAFSEKDVKGLAPVILRTATVYGRSMPTRTALVKSYSSPAMAPFSPPPMMPRNWSR